MMMIEILYRVPALEFPGEFLVHDIKYRFYAL
jgi:hypothetical protein